MSTKLTTYRKSTLREMTPNLKEQAKAYNELVKILRGMRRHIDQRLAEERGIWRFHQDQARARRDGLPEWDVIEPVAKPEPPEIVQIFGERQDTDGA